MASTARRYRNKFSEKISFLKEENNFMYEETIFKKLPVCLPLHPENRKT
jgi:hypothetical protein